MISSQLSELFRILCYFAYVVLDRDPIAYVLVQYVLSIPDGNLNEQLSDEQNPEPFRKENAG